MSRYHTSQPHNQVTSAPRASVGTGYTISDDDRTYSTRLPNSTRRYKPQNQSHAIVSQKPRSMVVYQGEYTYVPQRRQLHTTQPQPKKQKVAMHCLTVVGIVMLFMVTGWIIVGFVISWWQTYQDDIRYGRPRTAHIDAVVGHNDSAKQPSHFIALNVNRQVQVIEYPGGDFSKAKLYQVVTLLGSGQDLTPVTLSFVDVTADKKPDMIVHVGQSQFVFINENNSFRPQRAGEQIAQKRSCYVCHTS